MNLLLLGMLIFVLIYILLNWLTKNSSKTIANTTRKITLISSFVLAIILTFAGKFIFSLPMALLFLNALKIKGLSTFQIFQLWRLISYLRSTGRFSYTSSQNTRSSSNNGDTCVVKQCGIIYIYMRCLRFSSVLCTVYRLLPSSFTASVCPTTGRTPAGGA